MRSTSLVTAMQKPLIRCSLISSMVLVLGSAALAQVSPEEHAKHHPQKGAGPSMPATEDSAPLNPAAAQDAPGAAKGGGMMGGGPGGGMGGGGMGGMMESMGVPPPKELYPSLMDLPDLPLEKRAEVQEKAHARMQEGAGLLASGLSRLSRAAPGDDFREMQDALGEMREGLARFDSGLAAHRALAEGSAPRNVALQWFKGEMNLLPPPAGSRSSAPFGLSPFHFFSMALLVAFAAAMVWMYFHKMRRAAELVAALAAEGASGGPATVATAVATVATARPDAPAPALSVDPLPVAAPAASPGAPSPAVETPRSVAGKRWSGALRVCRIFDETHDVKTFRMVPTDGAALPLTYRPGQFMTLSVEPDGKQVKRSYTIASSPTVKDYLEITVKREEHGLVSRFLHDVVKEGDVIDLSAPAGKFSFTGEEADSIVLIGGGVGITPMMSAIRYLTDRGWPGEIYLLYCCRTTNDFIFREELEFLQRRNPNLTVVATMTRERGTVWMGSTGRLTPEMIRSAVPQVEAHRVHICGPPPMMDAVKEMLDGLGVPAEQVRTEAFGAPKRRRPAAETPAVESPPSSPAAPRATQPASVTFARSSKSGPLGADDTVLDVADALGVEIDSSCRSGTCGSCKVKLLAGQVTMEVEDALEPDEKADGIILACQACSEAAVVIDA